jgi:hypothetical protein
MTVGSDMDAGLNIDHTSVVPLAVENRRRVPSTTCSSIRYRSVVKFQPCIHDTGCRETIGVSPWLRVIDSGDIDGTP